MRLERHGGLTFWRIGRLGGSFYIARPKVRTYQQVLASYRADPPAIDWRNDYPNAGGYSAIGVALICFLIVFVAIGYRSGFIG